MKKIAMSVCILGTAVALSACGTHHHASTVDQAPYAHERTAGGGPVAQPVRRAQPVFDAKQRK